MNLCGCIYLCAGQVDWAALAQAWIAQKESTGAEQPSVQPNGQEIPGIEHTGPNNHGAFQGDQGFNRVWQPGWWLCDNFSVFIHSISSFSTIPAKASLMDFICIFIFCHLTDV